MTYIAILGRQPEISLAELISLFPGAVTRLNEHCAQIEADTVDINRIGGTIKLGLPLGSIPHVPVQDIASALCKHEVVEALAAEGEGKLNFGLSIYGEKLSAHQHTALGLELKKRFKVLGRGSRFIDGKSELSAAQIHHNHLLKKGADLWIIKTSDHYVLARATAVQDIAAFAARDHGRPARSAKVGMLPPKLAQIMINMAAPKAGGRVLDPFCGTGVVLQEAGLLGYESYGSDIEPELISMSRTNEAWLHQQHADLPAWTLETGDATNHRWSGSIDAVVTEGFLGAPQSKQPDKQTLAALKSDASKLTLAFLRNLAIQITPGTPVCITLPCWRQANGFADLDILDQITRLGYTQREFLPVRREHLRYARPDQTVGRQITVLIKT